jgi:hypothetical protein
MGKKGVHVDLRVALIPPVGLDHTNTVHVINRGYSMLFYEIYFTNETGFLIFS